MNVGYVILVLLFIWIGCLFVMLKLLFEIDNVIYSLVVLNLFKEMRILKLMIGIYIFKCLVCISC